MLCVVCPVLFLCSLLWEPGQSDVSACERACAVHVKTTTAALKNCHIISKKHTKILLIFKFLYIYVFKHYCWGFIWDVSDIISATVTSILARPLEHAALSAGDLKMSCFVLPVRTCGQCMRESQQNIRLDMLLFALACGQCKQSRWKKSKGQTVQRRGGRGPEEGVFECLWLNNVIGCTATVHWHVSPVEHNNSGANHLELLRIPSLDWSLSVWVRSVLQTTLSSPAKESQGQQAAIIFAIITQGT